MQAYEEAPIALSPRQRIAPLALALALVVASPARALERVVVDIGRVDAGDWSAAGVVLALALSGNDRLSAELSAAELAVAGRGQVLGAVSVACPESKATDSALVCESAELALSGADGEPARLAFAMRVDARDGRLRLQAENAHIAPGPLWDFAARQDWLPAMTISAGDLALEVELQGAAHAARGHLVASLSGASFSDAQGLHAGEGVHARLSLRLAGNAKGWRTSAELAMRTGQIYLDPIFVDAGRTPLSAIAEGEIDSEAGRLHVSRLQLNHESVASIEGEMRVTGDGDVEALALRLGRAPLEPLYRTYLQPFAIGTLLDALDIDGDVEADLDWRASQKRVHIDLDAIDMVDRRGRFDLSGIAGRLAWNESAGRERTTLDWDAGQLYRIEFGPGALEGRLSARHFELDGPVSVPVLGGAIHISDFRLDAIGTPDLEWQFRGSVEPMSLMSLTEALEWPSFGGTLGGDIPLVSYQRGIVSVDGSLDVAVFDGRIGIRHLSIVDPFGIIPVLRADVDVDDLSLRTLTGTFSFGNIEGQLEGHVHGLVLKDWKPTRFEAEFATPDDDETRHRISQRAVENLASLGGAGAVLSTTFLSMFKEFSYRRLGISCRLEKGVCDMDGVAPAERGYYIVQGGGLPPRIDVLGFNRRVDWEVLLGRLRQIVTTQHPIIR